MPATTDKQQVKSENTTSNATANSQAYSDANSTANSTSNILGNTSANSATNSAANSVLNSANSGTSNVSLWAPQANDLETAFRDAMSAYAKSSSATAPTDFTASFSPEQLASFRSMIGYGNNTAVPDTQAATGNTLANAGSAGTTGALSGYAGFDPTALNSSGSLVDAANKYVAGQDIPSQVRLVMQGATENARDVTMPGIEQAAAASGNTNSSRTGIAQGIVQRGLAEQSANLEGSLRSQAFQNALTLAQQQAQNNNTDKLAALSGQGALGTSAASTGNSASNSSVANMMQLLSSAAAGGQGLTQADQAKLTNALQQYQSGVTSPYASLNPLMDILRGNYGTSTTTSGVGTNVGTNSTNTTGNTTQATSQTGSQNATQNATQNSNQSGTQSGTSAMNGVTNEHDTQTASPLSLGAGILSAGTSLLGTGGLNLLEPLGAGILKRFA